METNVAVKDMGNRVAHDHPFTPEITLYNICDVIEAIFGPAWTTASYDATTVAVRQWAEQNNANIYSSPRESFSIYEAVHLAAYDNKAAVILEDLS
jgi:hypothetical protein